MTDLRHTEEGINSTPKYLYNSIRDSSTPKKHWSQNDKKMDSSGLNCYFTGMSSYELPLPYPQNDEIIAKFTVK